MPFDLPTLADQRAACPACGEPLADHPQCRLCRCLLHKGAWCRWDQAVCRDCDRALFRRGARRCTRCAKIAPLRLFRAGRFFRRTCRPCHDAALPRERTAAYKKKYAQAHRPMMNAASAAWRARNPEQVRASRRRQYQRHKDTHYARIKRWRERNHERYDAYMRAYRDQTRTQRRAADRARHQKAKLRAWFGLAGRDD